jgi:hypothetical protein
LLKRKKVFEFMQKFINFVYYNVIVYILYYIIDSIFTFLNLYSSPQLGKDLFVMPTNSDMTYIAINIAISSIFGLYLLKKFTLMMKQ